MVCSSEGFPLIESLTLGSLIKLEELSMGEGALSVLCLLSPSHHCKEEMPKNFDNWLKEAIPPTNSVV